MSAPRRFLIPLAGLVPTILVATLAASRPPLLAGFEQGVYDRLLRASPTGPPHDRVVIVDVDERSLSAIGQWPWRRDIVGGLVSRLRNLGATTIALDFMFSEADRLDGTGISSDVVLADALRAGRVVLGYALTFDETQRGAVACAQHPLGLPVIGRGEERTDEPFFRATGAICSLPTLTQAAGASGFLNAAPDPDGVFRRFPLLLELNGHIYPALALAALVEATGARDLALTVVNINTSSLQIGGSHVPLDGKSNLLVRYRGPKRTFPYVSAADVLSGRAGTSVFKDKLVFVGTTALGTREVVSTPLDTLFAGVEVQATVADNLLQQDFIHRPASGLALEMLLVLALGIMATLLVDRFGIIWGALGAVTIVAGGWLGAFFLMSTRGVFLSPLYPTVGTSAAAGAMAVVWFTLEHRRADRAVVDKTTSQHLMIQSLLSLTAIKDAETGKHSRRTQRYARVLAEQLATHPKFRHFLTPENINLLSTLAPLHDIGKVGVPDHLLNKPGALTVEELAEMRRHPVHGRDVIVSAEDRVGVHDDAILAMAKDIVYTHHEKWDGSGYPEGLRGTEIPIAGRLMAIVDVYDAVVTRRLYCEPMSHDEAVALIVKGRGTHFDPDIIDAFVRVSDVLQNLSDDQRPAPVSMRSS